MKLLVIILIRFLQIQIVEIMLPLVITVRNGHVVAIFVGEICVVVFYPQGCRAFKLVGRRRAQNRLLHHALGTVVIVSHEVTFVIIVFQENLSYLLLNMFQ